MFSASLKPRFVFVKLRVERWAVHSGKRNPANAVSSDTIVAGEAGALKDAPITVTLLCNIEPASLRKPANLSWFLLQATHLNVVIPVWVYAWMKTCVSVSVKTLYRFYTDG